MFRPLHYILDRLITTGHLNLIDAECRNYGFGDFSGPPVTARITDKWTEVRLAFNPTLEEAVQEGRFRTDLFFRLNVFPIRVPALRERPEDIPLLAEYWASRYARTVGKVIRRIDETAMTALCAYPWPGNIRELQNVVERAVILARGSALGLRDFELPSLCSEPPRPSRAGGGDERQQIEEALAASRGRVYGPEGAAETLRVPPSTLESRIRRLGIDKHAFRRRVHAN